GVGRTGLAGCVAPRYPACSIFGVECASEPRMATERSETPAVTHPPVEVVSLRAAAPASPDRPVPRAAAPGGGGGGGIDSDWERYLGAVRRRKWLVLALTALGTLLGVLASRLLRPEYSATALLWFEAQDRSRDARATEPDE